MKTLHRAIRKARERDPRFTGSLYAIEQRTGVGHQSIKNLLNSKTQPHKASAGVALALVEAFYGDGLRLDHFRTPRRTRAAARVRA